MFKDEKLLKRSIELITLRFRLHTSNTGLIELFYISVKTWLKITTANEFQCFVLAEVASKNIIVIILKNICTEITSK